MHNLVYIVNNVIGNTFKYLKKHQQTIITNKKIKCFSFFGTYLKQTLVEEEFMHSVCS